MPALLIVAGLFLIGHPLVADWTALILGVGLWIVNVAGA